jgi:hypothetical protein
MWLNGGGGGGGFCPLTKLRRKKKGGLFGDVMCVGFQHLRLSEVVYL